MSSTPTPPPVPPIPPPPISPKRGGIHPQFGKFIGGAKLNDRYETVGASGASLYRFSTQRRHEKTIASIEKMLRDARDSTTGLKFNGENVTDLAGEAPRLLKIMAGAYAVPMNTGSTLLMKLTHTSSKIFNRKIFALLDQVMTLEAEYELKDPRLFASDISYNKYGPLALAAAIQASHGMLLSHQRWPTMASVGRVLASEQ